MKKIAVILGLSLFLVACGDTTTVRVCELKERPFTITYHLSGHNDKIENVYRTVVIDTRIFTDVSTLEGYLIDIEGYDLEGYDLYIYKTYPLASGTYYDVAETLAYLTALGYECY